MKFLGIFSLKVNLNRNWEIFRVLWLHNIVTLWHFQGHKHGYVSIICKTTWQPRYDLIQCWYASSNHLELSFFSIYFRNNRIYFFWETTERQLTNHQWPQWQLISLFRQIILPVTQFYFYKQNLHVEKPKSMKNPFWMNCIFFKPRYFWKMSILKTDFWKSGHFEKVDFSEKLGFWKNVKLGKNEF